MKTIILTLTGEDNYGNKFQNYAIHEKISSKEYKAITVRFFCHHYFLSILKWYLLYFFCHSNKNKSKRKILFFKFNNNISFKFTPITHKRQNKLKYELKLYKKIIYGSDQIWNPTFSNFTEAYLGTCAPREKNIALSASFGVDEIPEQYRDLFRKALLNNFSAISVREYQGAKIIKDLTGMDVEVLPDPTLTLSREKWEALEKPVSVPKEYYLTYFLGNKPEQTISAIDLIQGLSHVSAEPDQPLGPSEFLYLIHRAKYMCTDSFHGCVFSIIYQVPFMLFTRQDSLTSMNSRLTSLFQMLGLKGEQHKGYTFVTKEEICSDTVQDNLKAAVQRFNQFLEKNL